MRAVDFQKYVLWIQEKKSFSLIREDLIKNGFAPDEVKSILVEIDEQLTGYQQAKINKTQGIQWVISGVILTALSALVFFLAFLPLTFLAYGGVVSGTGMIVWGRRKISSTNYSFPKRFEKKSFFRKRGH